MERSKMARVFRKIPRGVLKIAIPVAVVLLLLAWAWYLNQPPHFTLTPPIVPADNALDYFQRASEATLGGRPQSGGCRLWH